MNLTVITSIHPDYDARIWKHCQTCKRLGYQVTLLCQWDSIESKEVVLDGIKIVSYGKVGKRPLRMIRNNFKVLKAIMSSAKSDLYHFHDIDILPVMTLFSFFMTVVYDIHENYPEEMLERYWIPVRLRKPLFYLVWFMQYLSVKKIQNVVLVSESQEKRLPDKGIKKIYIYNYASKNVFANNVAVEPEPFYDFVFTASQYRENGIELLIEAVDIIKSSDKKLSIFVADRFKSDEYRKLIFNKIENLKLQAYITFFQNALPHELPVLLSKCKVGLVLDLPSQRRLMAIPTKIFEYYAAGLKVIGSDLPNNKRFINEARLGSIFKAGDADSLAKKMLEVMSQPVDRDGIKQIFEDNYSWESQDNIYEEYYRQCLNIM